MGRDVGQEHAALIDELYLIAQEGANMWIGVEVVMS